jgi:hypothetical protein
MNKRKHRLVTDDDIEESLQQELLALRRQLTDGAFDMDAHD